MTKSQQVKDLVVKLFEYYYRELNGMKWFRVNLDKMNQRRSLDLFVKRISKVHPLESLGFNFFNNYMIYSCLWKHNSGRFDLLTVIGPTAIDRYKNRDQDWLYKNDYWLGESGVKKYKKEEYIEPDLGYSDDVYRKKFHNTQKGIVICLEYTTMADPESLLCKTCIHLLTCKQLLKDNIEPLYQNRWT